MSWTEILLILGLMIVLGYLIFGLILSRIYGRHCTRGNTSAIQIFLIYFLLIFIAPALAVCAFIYSNLADKLFVVKD